MTGGSFSELTPPATGEYILRQWGLDVRDSVVLRFASATARDAALTGLGVGDDGLCAYLQDTDHLTIFNGSIWVPASPRLLGANYLSGSVTSTGTEAAMTAWTGGTASYAFENGHLYKLELTVSNYNTGTANYYYDNTVRLRKGVNTTSGQQLGIWRCAAPGGSSPISVGLVTCFVNNASGATITTAVGVTVQKSTGTNAVIIGNAAENPLRLEVYDMGSSSRFSAGELTAMLSTAIV